MLRMKVQNLNTLTIVIKSILKCEYLDLKESFQRTCFKHVFFSKAYQKVYKGFFFFWLLKKIYKNAPFDQRNLLKVGRNGIRLTLKLVWGYENYINVVLKPFFFCILFFNACFFNFGILKLFIDPWCVYVCLQIKPYCSKKHYNSKHNCLLL